MDLQHKGLMHHCVSVLDTFDPDSRAMEAHVNEYLKYNNVDSESDQTFIVEVFSGCVRYTNVLKVIMNGFFNRDGKTVLRSQENIYKVVAYLALFRLDELGMGHFRKFVRTQDVNKMYKFLNFAMSDKNLQTWMKDEWCKLYETSFVQTTLLSPLLRWLPEIQELINQLKEKIDAKTKAPRPQIPLTVKKKTKTSSPCEKTQPFKLTQPRPRSIPIPEVIPTLQKHRPVPKSLYSEPTEVDVISKIKEENRRKAEERLMDASRQQFACANPEKSDKTKTRISEIIQENESKLEFNKTKSHPLPHSILKDNIPIKLNTAAILREGRLYRKREVAELRKLESLEAGAKDASEFLDWQSKMKQQDTNEKLADIERRRLEGKLSHEDAILAKQNLMYENKRKAEEMKEEARRLMDQYLQNKMAEEETMKGLVEKVTSTHENAKEAKKKLQEYKAKIVQEVAQESRDLMRQALEEAEQEMRQKMELIRQIRAMEATPVIRFKLVDLAEKAGHGLLSEMSIAELNERIALMKIANKESEESKRDEILASKQNKDQMLMDSLETISRHRTENTKAAAVRLETRKKERNTKPEIQDEKLIELQRKLGERRAERLREQEKNKISPSKKSAQRLRQLSTNKKGMEEHRWEELELTRQRAARLSSQGVSQSATAARVSRAMVPTYS